MFAFWTQGHSLAGNDEPGCGSAGFYGWTLLDEGRLRAIGQAGRQSGIDTIVSDRF